MSRKQIAYLNLSHTREKDLRAATEEVINAYNQYELPRHWGSGSTASVDGTRFEMLRVAVSISEGKVSASTIIRRLGANGIRNSLYYAFRELGRVVRTQFLLQYISEIELRESVHAATCKGKEFNQFVQWVFFYNNGLIQENLRHAQNKMIAYNHLVANLVILHNVDSMSKAINKLKRQGFKVDDEALRSLSPYRTEHINLLGTYSLKIPKQQGNRNFKLM